MLMHFRIIFSCLIPRLELGIVLKYDKCLFGQFGSLFPFDSESVLHLDGSDLST